MKCITGLKWVKVMLFLKGVKKLKLKTKKFMNDPKDQ